MTSPTKVQEPKGDQIQPSRLHLLPNKITLFRVLLAPILVMLLLTPGLYNAPIAALVIALGSVTDWLDGHLARRWAVESDFGRLLDPIADKLILVAALVPLAAYGQVPAWMAVLLIGREVAVTVLRSIAVGQGLVISANDTGKYKTAFQMVALILLILDFEWGVLNLHLLGMIALWIALILSISSGWIYFHKFWRQVNS